jgi:hypothetical protein
MAYIAGDTILDAHYNGFVTSVNAIWGTGTGVRGLGQSTVLDAVSAGNSITASQWATLLTRIKSISNHQGNNGNITVDSVTNPSATDTIAIVANLATDIGTIDTSAAAGTNAAGFGSAITDTAVVSGTFVNTITQTNTLTFASAAAMRYWFNAGGKVTTSWAVSGGTADAKYNEWVDLASKCGTWEVFNSSSGKTGGSGTLTTNNTNAGFWDLTTSPTVHFKQLADTSPYTANFIQLAVSLNAAPGSSTVMTLTSTWSDAAADSVSFNKAIYNVLDQVDGSKTTTFNAYPPATTYITATWGTPSWATTVNTES